MALDCWWRRCCRHRGSGTACDARQRHQHRTRCVVGRLECCSNNLMENTFSLIAGPPIVGLLLAGCASNEQADVTDVQSAEIFTVEDPCIKATDESLDETSDDTMTCAFVHLTNVSGEDQTVVGAKSEIAEVVELHEVIDDGGASVMQEKPGGFPVAAEEAY